MSPGESLARAKILSIFTNNVKNFTLLKRYQDPYVCWNALNRRYEKPSGPRKNQLIENFFGLRKTNSITMNAHLTEVKNVADMLEEVSVPLPEEIVVYYTVKHLPKEYKICRRMLMNGEQLREYEVLESHLLSEEISLNIDTEENGVEALVVYRNRRPFYRNSQHGSSSSNGGTQRSFRHRLQGTRYRALVTGHSDLRFLEWKCATFAFKKAI